MEQTKWFERKFDFSSNQNIFPSIIERLCGTPARLEEKLRSISPEIFESKLDGAWSIKEHIGHLTDLEPLWQGRLQDFLDGKTELRPADLQNTKTNEANHNARSIETLLREFRQIRKQTIHQLETVTEEQVFRSALHPRLKTPMRLMDSFLFVAEHDDHHLASITALSHRTAHHSPPTECR
jgi:uncharacterized damage-inducible protein DinB